MASIVNSNLPYLSAVADAGMSKLICAHVARLLREERQRQKLSMNALAERSGLSRQMVSYIEQGKRNPTLDTLLRLTSALGVTSEKLLQRARKAAAK